VALLGRGVARRLPGHAQRLDAIIFGLIALAGVGAAARGSWLGIVLVFGCGAVITYGAATSVADDHSVLGGSSGWCD
jgi:hypothetical protein